MANYLQRIADSGARTSSIAKPPAAARGLMPPVGPLLSPAIGEEAPLPMEGPPDLLMPVRATATASEESEAPALPLPENKPEAGKSAPPPVAIPQRITPQNSASQTSVRAPEALRASAASAARERSVHKVAEETIRTFAPRALANRGAHDQPVPSQIRASEVPLYQPNPAPVPQHTAEQKLIAPANEPQRSLPRERVRVEEPHATIQPSKTVGEPGPVIKEASPRIPPETRLTGDEKKDTGTAKPVPAQAKTQSKLPVGQESLREKPFPETRLLQVPSTSPARSARQPAPTESRRGTQISIGRIDVQVNNQAPPQVASQKTARVPARMNSLEQRYLGRFFLTL